MSANRKGEPSVLKTRYLEEQVVARVFIDENAQLKRRIRLARDIIKSRAFAERGYFRPELLDLLDLRKPLRSL